MSEDERFARTYISREWWQITRPNGQVIEVFMCPPRTQIEMLAMYVGCGVLPL